MNALVPRSCSKLELAEPESLVFLQEVPRKMGVAVTGMLPGPFSSVVVYVQPAGCWRPWAPVFVEETGF